jgi:hypothetical protein
MNHATPAPQPEDPFDELEDKLDHPALDWDPRGVLKDAEAIYTERRVVGTVEDRETLTGMQKKPYERLIVKLRGEATRVSVRCWGTVLSSKVRQRDPRPGDLVAVEYFGSKPNSDPDLADIELFEMHVHKPAPTIAAVEDPDGSDEDDEEVS